MARDNLPPTAPSWLKNALRCGLAILLLLAALIGASHIGIGTPEWEGGQFANGVLVLIGVFWIVYLFRTPKAK